MVKRIAPLVTEVAHLASARVFSEARRGAIRDDAAAGMDELITAV